MVEAAVAKKGRTKKGEGPYELIFVDTQNKDSSRVPNEVSSIKIKQKDGKEKAFALSMFSPVQIQQLAADGLKRRLDSHVRNNVGGDKTVIALADEMIANVKAGKLYTRSEGKGTPGRSFDFELYVDCIKRLAEIKNESDAKKYKKATNAQLADLRKKLEASTPQARNELVKKWKKDPVFNLAKKQVEAERANKAGVKVDANVDALADLF